jgi:hypothetical protein
MPLISGAVVWLLIAHVAVACPFCGPVGRSLAERRDAADSVLVTDAAGDATRAADGLLVQPLASLAALRGAADVPAGVIDCRVSEPITGTGILFGSREPDGMRWEAIAADEALIAHVAAAPAVEEVAARRLRWFASRLEHANPAIAADAFTEFGLAPFADVRAVADAFNPGQLQTWLADPSVDRRRRGFYAVALGLAIAATERPADRSAGITALHAAVEESGDDLRAGYDGILAGVLVAEPEAGLAYLRDRGLFAMNTRPGDAKHALAALRFAWECLADSIPRDSVAEATAGLLDNPAVAADAAVDLARYERWGEVDRVATLWQSLGRDDPLVRRAVAGYLEACPLPAAQGHRETLAASDSEAWAAARAAAAGPAR